MASPQGDDLFEVTQNNGRSIVSGPLSSATTTITEPQRFVQLEEPSPNRVIPDFVMVRQPMEIDDFISPPWDPIQFATLKSTVTDPSPKTVRYKDDQNTLHDDRIASLHSRLREYFIEAHDRPESAPIFYDANRQWMLPDIARVVRDDKKYVDISFKTYEQAAYFVHNISHLDDRPPDYFRLPTLRRESHGNIYDPRLLEITIVPYLQGDEEMMSIPTAAFAEVIAQLTYEYDGIELVGAWQDAIEDRSTGDVHLQRKAFCILRLPEGYRIQRLPGFVAIPEEDIAALDVHARSSAKTHTFELLYRSRADWCPKCLYEKHRETRCHIPTCYHCGEDRHIRRECPYL